MPRQTSVSGASEVLHSKMKALSHTEAPRFQGKAFRCLARTKTVVDPARVACGQADVWERWRAMDEGPGPLLPPPGVPSSVVFFSRHTVVVLDSDRVACLQLFRVGQLSEELLVSWATVDGTAVAGKDYAASAGVARFAPGSDVAAVSVDLLPAGAAFRTEKFFIVHAEVEGAGDGGADGGRGLVGGLPFARVRVLNTCPWPVGLPNAHQREQVQRRHLFLGFLHMLLKMRGEKYLYVVLGNFWMDFERVVLSTLLLNYALYDYCLTRAHDPLAYSRVPVVVLVKFVLVLIDRYADHYSKINKGVSRVTSSLQRQLIHKTLELNKDAVPVSKLGHLFYEVVPECVAHGYTPTFSIIQSVTVLLLSLLMAIVLPALKGSRVSFRTLSPLLQYFIFIPPLFYLVLRVRRSRYDNLIKKRCDAQARVSRILQDILDCRHWIRAFDSGYPAQHVRQILDTAAEDELLPQSAVGSAFQNDSQWIAKYFGEVFRLLAVLHGSYAVLENARTGADTMTLGELAVFLSLYSAVISAVYSIIEACGSFCYASVLLRELAKVLNMPNPRLAQRKAEEQEDDNGEGADPALASMWRQQELSIKISGAQRRSSSSGAEDGAWYTIAFEPVCDLSLEVPFGCLYAFQVLEDCDSTRRAIAAAAAAAPPFARALLVGPPTTLGAGPELEVLMAGAADWVRARDALAVAAVLGVPFDAPEGEEPHYGLSVDRLIRALAAATARASAHAEELPSGDDDAAHSVVGRRSSAASSAGSGAAAAVGRHSLQRLPTFTAVDTDYYSKSGSEFRARLRANSLTVLSTTAEVLPLLKAHEVQLVDLARALLADPDVLVVQDLLAGLPLSHGSGVVSALKAWQRLGGLRGLVGAWEEASEVRRRTGTCTDAFEQPPPSPERNNGRKDVAPAAFPGWLTACYGICRTVVLSESAVVAAGLVLDKHIDAWITVGRDNLKIDPAGLQAGAPYDRDEYRHRTSPLLQAGASHDRDAYQLPARRVASNPLVVDSRPTGTPEEEATAAAAQLPQRSRTSSSVGSERQPSFAA